MNRPFAVYRSPDTIAMRRVLFALELLDAQTLSRVSQEITADAQGLQGKPIVNHGGLFVWLQEDIGRLQKISINPGVLPYEVAELSGDQMQTLREEVQRNGARLFTIELSPRVDYPFDAGMTGLRGTLVEDRVSREPVLDAAVRLRWLDQDGAWHDSPVRSHTAAKGGDFVATLRLAQSEVPQLDADRNLTVRLHAARDAGERHSPDLKVLQGHIAEPSTQNPFMFAWDELQP